MEWHEFEDEFTSNWTEQEKLWAEILWCVPMIEEWGCERFDRQLRKMVKAIPNEFKDKFDNAMFKMKLKLRGL